MTPPHYPSARPAVGTPRGAAGDGRSGKHVNTPAALAEPRNSSPRDGAATRRRIIDEATMLFYERGYHATSMRDIAEAVGIKAGSLYNHFTGKQDILLDIALGSMEDLLAGGLRIVEEHPDDPAARLDAFIHFHVDYHTCQRFRAIVGDDGLRALSESNLPKALAVRDEYENILKTTLEFGRDKVGWHVPDVSVTAFAIATMCTAVGVWYREGGRLSPTQIADLYSDFCLAALRESGTLAGARDAAAALIKPHEEKK
jgi:AcrR family transcriptional regulator